MNEFEVRVYDINGLRHEYKSKKEIMDDVNFALNNNTNIEIKYYKEGKEGIVLFDGKKVLAVDIRDYTEKEEERFKGINSRIEEVINVD